MADRSKKYLFDIYQSIEFIFDVHLSGISSLDELESNFTALRAIERELGIMGEAMRQLSKMGVKLDHSDWMINFRNTIIHQYDQVAARTIYEHIQEDLPGLRDELKTILGDINIP